MLIIDWDVHTETGRRRSWRRSFHSYVSLHQWPLYPGTGRAEERGEETSSTSPAPRDWTARRYVRDLSRAVTEATSGWRPDLILISAGFDAMAGDPLAGFPLEPEDYVSLGASVSENARRADSIGARGWIRAGTDPVAAAAHLRALA